MSDNSEALSTAYETIRLLVLEEYPTSIFIPRAKLSDGHPMMVAALELLSFVECHVAYNRNGSPFEAMLWDALQSFRVAFGNLLVEWGNKR